VAKHIAASRLLSELLWWSERAEVEVVVAEVVEDAVDEEVAEAVIDCGVMLLEAVVEGLLGGEDGEGDDGILFASAVDVGAAGAVAAFATAVRRGVGVAEELLSLDEVTASAGLGADVRVVRYLSGSLGP
jgi:hypothetical protein